MDLITCWPRLRSMKRHYRQVSCVSAICFRRFLSVAVQGYGPDGTTHYWNSASERLYGYSAEEAIGRNLLELIIPPDMRQDVQSAVRQMFETGCPIPAGEISLMCKDGSKVDVFSSHAYVHVPGQLPEMFCLDIDLIERKRLEANQRIAAIAFESQEGMFITDADRVIVRVTGLFRLSPVIAQKKLLGRRCGDSIWSPRCSLPACQNVSVKRDMAGRALGEAEER